MYSVGTAPPAVIIAMCAEKPFTRNNENMAVSRASACSR